MKLRKLAVVLLILTGITSQVWALYCTGCGSQAEDKDQFCRLCGRVLPGQMIESNDRIKSEPINSQRVIPSSGQKAFQVTSYYLLVNGYRLDRKSLFWIAEVGGSQARIWSVDGPPYDRFVMGWVSLSELEKRSTLRTDSTIFCVEPPPTVTKVVVIERRNFWRRWGPGSFSFSRSRRGKSHRRYNGQNRRHGSIGSPRRPRTGGTRRPRTGGTRRPRTGGTRRPRR